MGNSAYARRVRDREAGSKVSEFLTIPSLFSEAFWQNVKPATRSRPLELNALSSLSRVANVAVERPVGIIPLSNRLEPLPDARRERFCRAGRRREQISVSH